MFVQLAYSIFFLSMELCCWKLLQSIYKYAQGIVQLKRTDNRQVTVRIFLSMNMQWLSECRHEAWTYSSVFRSDDFYSTLTVFVKEMMNLLLLQVNRCQESESVVEVQWKYNILCRESEVRICWVTSWRKWVSLDQNENRLSSKFQSGEECQEETVSWCKTEPVNWLDRFALRRFKQELW